jgi:hypothetical protein
MAKSITNQGGRFVGGQRVMRKNAFADVSVLGELTKYLKIVYGAKYPVPSEDSIVERILLTIRF